ncbi:MULTISPECIES: M20/M25/M40 family metallo-hydrolase [Pseudonocardia]|uniref:Acetylornithine deacetylase/Succinyl-diaminopimelate desuccinylase n=1 Tax=Pseudonocardia oroxyli TaxID=366584 RepID=A0A1G7VUZ3_PSEOR|nr:MULTISPECIES: M20/M25/M40 family metallo-hydrolase [Pseudonocardia]MCF7553465.1 M20/M25/M40 family metallo-hydrolase [Pseudonocardia sp. WMMC193]SDG63507.1 Acetylornithine deacetylase/Succinyl-diaminopimelate desuccinylase [Pseudonocardia oroxyli]
MTGPVTAADEVVELCSDLIRIDTSNTGDPTTVVGERAAAEYVAAKLSEVGYEVEVLDSGAPGRSNVFARLAGADPSRGALLVHGHLDVVPAEPSEWSVHPFSGAVQDGFVWGRGAVDMKDMVAMTIAVARRFKREGYVPPRDIVFAFLADEEAGGAYGSQWLVKNRPDLFEGCTEAVGEVGGFSLTLAEDQRVYLIETAEKGMAWMRLRAKGRPGHGSFLHDDNAVTILSEAVARLGNHRFPLVMTDTVRAFADSVRELTGMEFPDSDIEGAFAKLGPVARMVGATVRDTANPTMLSAGYKANVIPSTAEATVDCRVLPGRRDAFLAEVDELLGPDVTREWIQDLPGLETEFDGPLVDAMAAALRTEDPTARTVPYMLSGGTDAKAFSELGMRCFGFAPLRLPPDLDFASLFHGIDERVPVDALEFGARVMDTFLRNV